MTTFETSMNTAGKNLH